MYDQWRGEPLYVEDGLDDDKLYIRIMDVENYKRGSVNTITVDYKDLNGATYTILGECDYDKRLAIFDIPLSILSNNGIYEVGFSMTFNAKDKEAAAAAFIAAESEMMRAAQKGVFKKNTASRTISRLAQKIKAL